MIKNKKGFMLAEIIIVSVVVMVTLVSLFTLTNKMFLQYDKRIVYDEVDATYVARGLIENYSEDIMSVEFKDENNTYVKYDSSIDFLKKNNVVHAYIVRYDEDKLRNIFLKDIASVIGQNFYDYIETYINGNDFSDSSYTNTDEEADTYNYIIFTAISDNCDENKVCTEDNGNISFGNYKFKYFKSQISNPYYNFPPVIQNLTMSTPNRKFGDDIINKYTISWEIVNNPNVMTKETHVIILKNDGEFVKEHVVDGNVFSISEEIEPGNYYANVYAVDYIGNTGKGSCIIDESRYCSTSNQVTIGKINIEYSTFTDVEAILSKDINSLLYGDSLDITFNPGTSKEINEIHILDSKGNAMCDNCDSTGLTPGANNNITINLTNIQKDFTISASASGGCLVEGTKVLLANGTYKNIEDIDYNDLLMVYDHEYGKVSYQYAGWIEKPGVANEYIKVRFSDGNTLGFVNDHGVYSFDYNQYININDKEKFKIGSRIAKLKNNKVEVVYVTDIEYIKEDVKYYHILTNKHFNIITNDILTVNKEIFVSNFHGFDNGMKWQIPSLVDVYDYNEVSEVPYYMFKGLRLYEGKYFVKYGMDKDKYIDFLKDYILDSEKTLSPKLNKNGKRQWMVTTSEDVVTEDNKLSYLMEEGDYYTLKAPKNINGKKFIGWLHTGENIIYQPRDKVEVLYGTHFIAKYQDLFNNQIGGDYFEKNR